MSSLVQRLKGRLGVGVRAVAMGALRADGYGGFIAVLDLAGPPTRRHRGVSYGAVGDLDRVDLGR